VFRHDLRQVGKPLRRHPVRVKHDFLPLAEPFLDHRLELPGTLRVETALTRLGPVAGSHIGRTLDVPRMTLAVDELGPSGGVASDRPRNRAITLPLFKVLDGSQPWLASMTSPRSASYLFPYL